MDNNPNYTINGIINLFITVPSLIGSFLVCRYCLRGISTNTVNKLILSLALSDFFYSLTNLAILLNYSEDSSGCTLEALSRNFFFGLAIWIATSISVLHYKIVKSEAGFKGSRFVAVSVISGVIVSLILSLRYLHFFCLSNLNI